MPPHSPPRSRTPRWIRDSTTERLHGIAGYLVRHQTSEDLTTGEEWLWRAVIDELERRWRRPSRRWPRCECPLCRPPFPY